MNSGTSNLALKAILERITTIRAQLDQLEALVSPSASDFDPKDPRNKLSDGKLSDRGVEVCYRLFDNGLTRYAVKEAMNISFGAATYRFEAWQKLGGVNRTKSSLD